MAWFLQEFGRQKNMQILQDSIPFISSLLGMPGSSLTVSYNADGRLTTPTTCAVSP